MNYREFSQITTVLTGVIGLILGMAAIAAETSEVDIMARTDGISVDFSTQSDRDVLAFNVRVVGPNQFVFEERVQGAIVHWIPPDELADGWYNWEAWVTTVDRTALMREITPALEKSSPDHWFEPEDKQTHLTSGSFRVEHGLLLQTEQIEDEEEASRIHRVAAAILDFLFPSAYADSFDDTVTVNRDTFGPRLALFDANGTGLPWWRIEMTPEPANHLEIRYCDFALFGCAVGTEKVPFFIRRDTGRIGIGTTSPNSHLHVNGGTGVNPFRVQADGLTSLFVHSNRGVSVGANATPPPNGLHVSSLGNSGFGTTAPAFPIHVQRADNSAQFRVEDTGASNVQTMFTVENNGHTRFRMRNAAQDVNWDFRTAGSGATEQFQITRFSTADGSTFPFRLLGNGDLEILGTLTENSSRAIKEQIVELTTETILGRLNTLAVHEWSYQANPGIRHVGPMAEEFHAAFALGKDSTRISPRDLAGVALAAAKALNEKLEYENNNLRDRNNTIEGRLERLEAILDQRL